MTEPCRTDCSKQITYKKITFSDGIFFSIPLSESGVVHNCENIQNAEYDLEENDNSILTEMSEDRGALNHEGRKKYRTAIQAIAADVVWHLENKLGFEEDREDTRRLIGFYLNDTFIHVSNGMNRQEVRDLPIMTRIIGKEFTYLELLGFLYQLDGFYEDAKICFEFMEPQYADSPAAEEEIRKGQKAGDIPTEWGLLNSDIIALMEERIEQRDVGNDELKKIGGMWFNENWSEKLKDYWKEVKSKCQDKFSPPTIRWNQSKTSLDTDSINDLKKIEDEISDEEVRPKILKFEKSVLRPFVRKQFPSNEEMEKKLKSMSWGKNPKETLYDKAKYHQSKEKSDTLKSKDTMGVGLLRFLDIGDLVNIVWWPNNTILRCLKDIANRRNKLMAHPNDYDEVILKHTNNQVVAEIGVCVRYFEIETSRPSDYLGDLK